jgi:hypothetical protein
VRQTVPFGAEDSVDGVEMQRLAVEQHPIHIKDTILRLNEIYH